MSMAHMRRHLEVCLTRAARLCPELAVTQPRQSGQTFSPDFLAGLKYWRGLPGNAKAPAALLYGGEESYTREGLSVMSWRMWG